jgi:hypothetical protein
MAPVNWRRQYVTCQRLIFVKKPRAFVKREILVYAVWMFICWRKVLCSRPHSTATYVCLSLYRIVASTVIIRQELSIFKWNVGVSVGKNGSWMLNTADKLFFVRLYKELLRCVYENSWCGSVVLCCSCQYTLATFCVGSRMNEWMNAFIENEQADSNVNK